MFMDNCDMACDFAGMLVCHMGKSAWPGYDDPEKKHTIALAKKLGYDKAMARQAKPDEPIPLPIRFREMTRSNTPVSTFPAFRAHAARLRAAISAVWLEHPDVDIALVEDLMWSVCDATTRPGESTWMQIGNDGRGWPGLQLHDSDIAYTFAEGVYLLGDRLAPEVTERMTKTLYENALLPGTDWRNFNWWHWGRNNQNHVNVSNLIGVGLYLIKDVYQLASFLMPLVENLKYGLEGFTDDGGCTEGIDYWDYGFMHFLRAAIMLQNRTGGALNLMAMDPKIERICRFPLSVYFEDKIRACWADSFYGYITIPCALMINHFFDIPELFACCHPNIEERIRAGYEGLGTFSLYKQKKIHPVEFSDAYLPELGTVKLLSGQGKARVGLAVQGGHNGVHHNHNDIGSFLFYKNGVPVLTDPGYPDYAAVPGNFGAMRYQCVYNNTFGHSAPIINGKPQPAGEEYRGVLSVDGLDTAGDKTVYLDMHAAYDIPTLKTLNRTYRLTQRGELFLTDQYAFTRKPRDVYEQFITYENATVKEDQVIITSGRKRFTLSVESTPGHFTVEHLEEDAKFSRGQGVITRIRFYPAKLGKDMTLAFKIV